MKILVFSDSHGKLENLKNVLNRLKDKMDMVVHLGDYDRDVAEIIPLLEGKPIYVVKGNNDYGGETPSHKLVRAGGKGFLLTHGHKQRVSWNTQTISYWAEELGADMVLFGHTHRPVNEESAGLYLFNPGSISLPRDSRIPTFGIVTVENGRMEGAIMEYHGADTFFRRK